MSAGRQRFSIIPAQAVTDRRLEPRDLQVLCLLGRHTDDLGWCCRSQVKMAKELACGRATVQRAISRLVEAGYVEHRAKQRESGADAAHDYRVVLDQREEAMQAAHGGDSDAENPDRGVPTGGQGCPPMDGQGVPTHERAPMLTTPVKRSEREGAGARSENEIDRDEAGEERRGAAALERRYWRLVKSHPQAAGVPKHRWLDEWLKLSFDEQDRAERRHGAWLALLKRNGKDHVPALSTYFAQKLFDEVDDPQPGVAPGEAAVAKPWSPQWGAQRMVALLAGPRPIRIQPTAFLARLMAQDDDQGRRERQSWQARHGFPDVNFMQAQAANRRGVPVENAAVALVPMMEPVPIGSVTWHAWQAHHEVMGWPWLPDPGEQPVVFFPRGGPERLADFEAAVSNLMRGGHDGDRRQAAE